jgi:hypothetical protein
MLELKSMSTRRSDSVFEYYRAASEKFDYFVVGVTGALCAYISQTFAVKPISVSPQTLELTALLVLVLSVIAGFKRIELSLVAARYNAHTLRVQEQKGNLVSNFQGGHLVNSATGEMMSASTVQMKIQVLSEVLPEFEEGMNKSAEAAGRWYHVRNWLLLCGFLMLVSARVWSAYVPL